MEAKITRVSAGGICIILAALCFFLAFITARTRFFAAQDGSGGINLSWRDGGYFFLTMGLFLLV